MGENLAPSASVSHSGVVHEGLFCHSSRPFGGVDSQRPTTRTHPRTITNSSGEELLDVAGSGTCSSLRRAVTTLEVLALRTLVLIRSDRLKSAKQTGKPEMKGFPAMAPLN